MLDIARTVLLPYLNHATQMYQSGYATAADIDAAMRHGCGHPVGPLAWVDQLGAAHVVAGLDELHARTGDPLHAATTVLRARATDGAALAAAPVEDPPAVPAPLRRAVDRVAVVGSGTMAAGIAEVFARAGRDVILVGRAADRVESAIAGIGRRLEQAVARGRLSEDDRRAVTARLAGTTDREALATADLVIEAVAEDLALKERLFGDLGRVARPGAILATTTSSLSVDTLAARSGRPGDVVGLHFFNPAPVMRLVEVVSGAATSPEVAETARAVCRAVGKHPVSCDDRAGFVVNALLFPYLNDAVRLHESGAASMDEIDEALTATGLPMGPFALLDVVGLDVSLAIQRTLAETFGYAGWEPAPMLEHLVAEGRLGRKTGSGWRSHEPAGRR